MFDSKSDDSGALACNTEKDKEKLHYRTAGRFFIYVLLYHQIINGWHNTIKFLGILAGIWPCGTVTLIDELFRAEAKSQVYGSVHSLFYLNSNTLSDVSKSYIKEMQRVWSITYLKKTGFIVYDDGYHLKKFATNPSRRSLTPTARKIAETTIVVDKMHFRGHTDEWCKRHCDPNHFSDLENVLFFDSLYAVELCFNLPYRLILRFVNKHSHGYHAMLG